METIYISKNIGPEAHINPYFCIRTKNILLSSAHCHRLVLPIRLSCFVKILFICTSGSETHLQSHDKQPVVTRKSELPKNELNGSFEKQLYTKHHINFSFESNI